MKVRLGSGIAVVAFFLVHGHATAQSCPAGTVAVADAGAIVGGNTMCAASGGNRWQEQHRGGGELWDYKKGTDPVDPTKRVGSWSAAGSNVTHVYGSQSFTWLVCGQGSAPPFTTYTLVSTGSAGTITGVTIRSGQTNCP